MSLWADYFKEQEGYEIIEKEYGFISFLVRKEECLISHFYVVPDERGTKKGMQMGEEVSVLAKKRGCKHLSAAIYSKGKHTTYNIQIFTRYGFKIVGSDSTHIILVKDL